MLKNLSRDPPDQSTSDARLQLISAPWEVQTQPFNGDLSGQAGQFSSESHPLISPAGKPEARLLPKPSAPELSSIQILIQDELKLRADRAIELTAQIESALGLMYWMGMVTQPVSKGNG